MMLRLANPPQLSCFYVPHSASVCAVCGSPRGIRFSKLNVSTTPPTMMATRDDGRGMRTIEKTKLCSNAPGRWENGRGLFCKLFIFTSLSAECYGNDAALVTATAGTLEPATCTRIQLFWTFLYHWTFTRLRESPSSDDGVLNLAFFLFELKHNTLSLCVTEVALWRWIHSVV